MEFTEDFVKEHALTPEQIAAVKAFGSDYVAAQKKAWDDTQKETGNQYANGIIDGVVGPIEAETGLKREKGEKAADFLKRAAGSHLATKTKELDDLKAEYAEKIKNGGTDAALKTEIEAAKTEIDRLKKIEAEYEPIKGIKDQYDTATQELSALKLKVAFQGVKPTFPDSVNPYEAKAKWDEFMKETLDKYTIELKDDEPWAIDKENEHKRHKLSELADKDKSLQDLSQGRKQSGSGTTTVDLKTIEGVPFKVPSGATTEERSALIRKHITEVEKIDVVSPEFSKKFAEYQSKILGGK